MAHLGLVAARAEIAAQHALGSLVVAMVGRIDMPDATPAIEPDVPDPARLLRGGNRIGCDRIAGFCIRQLRGDRAVAEQHVAAGPERHLHRLADQFGTKARAINIEIGVEHPVPLGAHPADRTIFRKQHLGHGVGQMPDTVPDRMLAQQPGERHRIEMIRVVERPDIIGVGRELGRAHCVGGLFLRIGNLVPILRAAMPQQPIGQQVEPVARIGDLERV